MTRNAKFDRWFKNFTAHLKTLGWDEVDIPDQKKFEDDYEQGKKPAFSAEQYIIELRRAQRDGEQ